MLIFTATFLPMNFCTRTLSIPWLPLLLCCLLFLYHNNHLCCQHHSFLHIMLCLITALTSIATGIALEVIGVPTATVSLPRTGANLLQNGDQTTGSKPGAILVLGSGLDSSMYAANCAPVLGTQLPIVPSFVAALHSLNGMQECNLLKGKKKDLVSSKLCFQVQTKILIFNGWSKGLYLSLSLSIQRSLSLFVSWLALSINISLSLCLLVCSLSLSLSL